MFLIYYNCSLKLIKKYIINYSYSGSCPRFAKHMLFFYISKFNLLHNLTPTCHPSVTSVLDDFNGLPYVCMCLDNTISKNMGSMMSIQSGTFLFARICGAKVLLYIWESNIESLKTWRPKYSS